MYDAKNYDEDNEENLFYNRIYDRGYFEKVNSENMLTTKTSYIPNETINLE